MHSAKARGAYYTPARLAETLCRWAVRPGDRVLDPAAGDGVFLRAARALGARAGGFEIDPAAAKAAGAIRGDFFDHLDRRYDAVVGNPPYVHFTQANAQRKAREAAARLGMRFGSGASVWAPFLVAAAERVRPGGRMAMVIPRETLFVDYAHPLLAHLRAKFPRIDMICVRTFLFEGALVKVAVLLCGPGRPRFRIREVEFPEELTPELLEDDGQDEESFAWSRVPRECRETARRVLERFAPLSELADVSIGIVTGDKPYFLVRGLPSLPVVASPTWVQGAIVKAADLRNRPRLLDIPPDYAGGDAAVDAYLEEGRRRGVHRRYKCAERAFWWRPRMGAPPDAFLTYLNDRLPRLALNRARARCTNNLHRVTFHGSVSVGAFYNPATLLSIELGGRILGDGALKLEPGDAGKIRMPRTCRDPVDAVDAALRQGDAKDAFRIASAAAGLSFREHRLCARAHAELRDIRLRERRMR
ncbi:MAG: hypothetical protein HY716_09680 [Planctomycetes bacterium]|nr:hypothetical protein [Planctomycetota bacterium]